MDGIAEGDEPSVSPRPIKTYSLEEVAEMVLPAEMTDGRRWLLRRLSTGKIRGYKLGRTWRMTHEDVEDMIASHRKAPAPESERYPGGITRRSWLHHQSRALRNTPRVARVTPLPETCSLPSYFQKVYPESPEIIATLSGLTQTQQKLLERLRREGPVVVDGRERKTVEALVRRGLATYEAEYVQSEQSGYYIYRFTVRPAEGL